MFLETPLKGQDGTEDSHGAESIMEQVYVKEQSGWQAREKYSLGLDSSQ